LVRSSVLLCLLLLVALTRGAASAVKISAGGITRLAVLPFKNALGAGDVDLGPGISYGLVNALDGLPNASMLDDDVVAAAVLKHPELKLETSLADQTKLGRLLGLTYLVVGGYQKVADSLRIDARILNVGRGSLLSGGSISVSGKDSQYNELVDKLASKIIAVLKIGQVGAGIAKAGLGATDDRERREFNEALRQYHAGTLAALRQSLAVLDKLTEANATFADAYELRSRVRAALIDKEAQSNEENAEQALADATTTKRLRPRNPRAYRDGADALTELQRKAEAESEATSGLAFAPNDAQLWISLAKARGGGATVLNDALVHALRLQPSLVLLIDELPKVEIVNKTSEILRLHLDPASISSASDLELVPGASRIIAVGPGDYRLSAELTNGASEVRAEHFDADNDYKVVYTSQTLTKPVAPTATVNLDNRSGFTAHVHFSGASTKTVSVGPHSTKPIQLPYGEYSYYFVAGGATSKVASFVLSEEAQSYDIVMQVTLTRGGGLLVDQAGKLLCACNEETRHVVRHSHLGRCCSRESSSVQLRCNRSVMGSPPKVLSASRVKPAPPSQG